MDTIEILGLKLNTRIGVYAWEHHVKQPIIINLALGIDSFKAAQTDDLTYTLNYADLAKDLNDYLAHSHFNLIETLAHQIIEFIFLNYQHTQHIKLNIQKPLALRQARSVGLTLERSKHE